MSAYADLDTSILDELPPGRTPVNTVLVTDTRRVEVIERVRSACAEGRQAYWVCTLIEESEELTCQAAETTYRGPHHRARRVEGRADPWPHEACRESRSDGRVQGRQLAAAGGNHGD
jgi:RecG-like helicase